MKKNASSNIDIDKLIERFGYVTPAMLRGLVVSVHDDSLLPLRQVNGMFQSDVQVALNLQRNGGLDAADSLLAERPQQDSALPVGKRHVSLSQLRQNVIDADKDMRDYSDTINKHDFQTAPGNPGETQSN